MKRAMLMKEVASCIFAEESSLQHIFVENP